MTLGDWEMSKTSLLLLILLLILFSGCKKQNYYYRAATGRIAERNYTQAIWLLERGIEQDSRCYQAYTLLIEVHATRRTLHEVIPYFNRLSVAEEDNPYPDLALALIYQRQGFYREAGCHFREAIRRDFNVYQAYQGLVEVTFRGSGSSKQIVEDLKDYFDEIRGAAADSAAYFYGKGFFYLHSGKYSEAESSFTLAVKKAPRFVEGRIMLGTVMYEMKLYYRAMEHYEQALLLSYDNGDRENEARSHYLLGLTYNELADYPSAIRKFKNSRGVYHELGLRGQKALTLASIGLVYKNRSEYSKAISYCERAHALQKLVGDREGQRVSLSNLATIYDELGQYEKAIEYHQEQLQLSQFTGDRMGQVNALDGLGQIYSRMDDYNQAFGYYEEVLEICRESGSRAAEGVTLYNMGNLYYEQGDYRAAYDCYERALTMHALSDDLRSRGWSLYAIGRTTYKLEDRRRAREYFLRAIDIYKMIGNRLDEAELFHSLGTFYIEAGELIRARSCFDQALAIRREIGNREGEGESLTAIGDLYFILNDYSGAYHYYQKAIKIVEEVRSDFNSESFKTGYLGQRIGSYENIITSLYALHEERGEQGYANEAFYYAEKSKARGLLDLLTESSTELMGDINPELMLEEKRLEKKYAELNTALQLERSRPDSTEPYYKSRTAKLEGYLKVLEKRLHDQRLRIVRENPRYAQIRYPESVNIERVQESLLEPGMMLVEYKLTKNALFIWRITKSESRFYRVDIGKDELADMVLSLRNCFTGIIEEEFFVPRSLELYRLLLAPLLEDVDGVDNLLIIPDGILHYLPFETLVMGEGGRYRDLPYLLKSYRVRYSPSSSVAFNLLDKGSKRSARKELFAMGDPVFLDSSEVDYDYDDRFTLRDGNFQRLLYSGEEVKKIGSLFKNSAIYTRESATEEEIKSSGGLEDYKYIHLAAHGILNEDNPQLSGIVLSQDQDPMEDGFLQTREIFNLKLSADLVVLSACRTGLGKIVDGEGIIGLTRAWMYAGTPSLVVSLWSVNDRSTSRLMEQFYRNIRHERDFSDSLRAAKLNLIEEGEEAYSNPYFWAGFVLIGEE